jgi:hypothetical protein
MRYISINSMGKRKTMQYPKDFTTEIAKKPICGVLSVAMIANVTFARATQACKNNMLSFQKRHGGKTYHEQRINALKELGVECREIPVTQKLTLGATIELICRPSRTYMITTSSHVVTVAQDEVADQDTICWHREHPARRCFVRHIVEIV